MKVVVLFFFCSLMYGQQLHHHMLSAQGGVTTTSTGIKVTSTIAQQVAVGTFSSKSGIVSQGFQQSKISNIAPLPTDLIATLVYPNPIASDATFSYTLQEDSAISINIVDIMGRVVKTIRANEMQNAGDHQQNVAIGELASGNYLLVFTSPKGTQTVKLIKRN